jgi:energy-coupling factor transporter ATP-binding protein EcfA2
MAQTVVMVTHDPISAAHADRVVFLADGRIAGQLTDPTAGTVLRALRGGAPGCSRDGPRDGSPGGCRGDVSPAPLPAEPAEGS